MEQDRTSIAAFESRGKSGLHGCDTGRSVAAGCAIVIEECLVHAEYFVARHEKCVPVRANTHEEKEECEAYDL
jgi:hypothetical protein